MPDPIVIDKPDRLLDRSAIAAHQPLVKPPNRWAIMHCLRPLGSFGVRAFAFDITERK
jgi:hypothetical protein